MQIHHFPAISASSAYNRPRATMSAILYRETTPSSFAGAEDRDAVALRIDPSRRVTLRFSLLIEDPQDLEALRYARRAMIREERTRGLEWDEPSMEQPIFTATEIRWFILASQVAWCREKIADLIARANRARDALRDLGQ
jgi:hypothetical protein